MDLGTAEREQLYLIAWQGVEAPILFDKTLESLTEKGLIKKILNRPDVDEDGAYEATEEGQKALSPLARKATLRPANYYDLPPRRQWSIDEGLGILDWDGQ